MITGCLQQKNGYYYAVLYIKVDGKRKVKWVSTKLLVAEVSERKAKRAFEEIRSQFERQEEERLQKEAQEQANERDIHPDAKMEFTAYMEKWLAGARPTIATATYQSYANMIKASDMPYNIDLKDMKMLGSLSFDKGKVSMKPKSNYLNYQIF